MIPVANESMLLGELAPRRSVNTAWRDLLICLTSSCGIIVVQAPDLLRSELAYSIAREHFEREGKKSLMQPSTENVRFLRSDSPYKAYRRKKFLIRYRRNLN